MCCTPPMRLGEVGVVVAGEVEEAEQVAVADVEEEVARAGVVAILDQFDEREAEQALIELDRLGDIAADQGDVVDAPSDGRVAVGWPGSGTARGSRGGARGSLRARLRSVVA